jgi:hypothetical protein
MQDGEKKQFVAATTMNPPMGTQLESNVNSHVAQVRCQGPMHWPAAQMLSNGQTLPQVPQYAVVQIPSQHKALPCEPQHSPSLEQDPPAGVHAPQAV